MRIAAVLLLLLAGCSSSTDLIDEQVLDCDSGAAISVRAGLNNPTIRMERTDDQLMLVVEISNNSHEELTVKHIRAQQIGVTDSTRYRLDPVTRQFNQVIAENDDHLFELPVFGRFVGSRLSGQRAAEEIVLDVMVTLTNGDSYRCRFSVGSA